MARSRVGTLSVWLTAQDRGFSRNMRKARVQMTTTQRAAQKLNTSIKGIGTSMAGLAGVSFGIYGIARGVQAATGAFAKQELAVQTLRAALIKTGKDGEASLDRLTEAAARFQRQTTAADEDLIKATATLAQLAPSLNAQELESAQSAIIGLANTFTEGKLENAAVAIGKSLGGTVDLLARWGVGVGTAGDASERLNRLLPKTAKFYEVAAAATDTLSGRTQQLRNAYGDLLEQIGSVIVQSATAKGEAESLARTMYEWTENIESNKGTWVAWGRAVIAAFKFVGATFASVIQAAFNVGRAIGGVIRFLADAVLLAVGMMVDQVANALNWIIEQANKIPTVEIEWRMANQNAAPFLRDANRQFAAMENYALGIAGAFVRTGQSAGELAAAVDLAQNGYEYAVASSAQIAANTGDAADAAGKLAGSLRSINVAGPWETEAIRRIEPFDERIAPRLEIPVELEPKFEEIDFGPGIRRVAKAWTPEWKSALSNSISDAATATRQIAQTAAQTLGNAIINGIIYGIKDGGDLLKSVLAAVLNSALSAGLSSLFAPAGLLGGLFKFQPAELAVKPVLGEFDAPTYAAQMSVQPELEPLDVPEYAASMSIVPNVQALDFAAQLQPSIAAPAAPALNLAADVPAPEALVEVAPPQFDIVVNTYPSMFANPGEAARDPQAQVFVRDAMSRARYQGYR